LGLYRAITILSSDWLDFCENRAIVSLVTTLREGEWQRVVSELQGRWPGQTALVVGGGPSGKDWRTLKRKLKPDILIGVNGVVQEAGQELDFWVTMECGSVLHAPWVKDRRAKRRIYNFKIKEAIGDTAPEAYYVARVEAHPGFLLKDYGLGLIMGHFDHALKEWPTSTSLQAFHLACVLGCRNVHTVGIELSVGPDQPHHWYRNQPIGHCVPGYEVPAASRLREFHGVQTTEVWISLARWWRNKIRPMCDQEGIRWIEHSGGLWDLI